MELTMGQRASIQILVAIELGFTQVSYKEEAEKFLKIGKVTPALTIPFLQESDIATKLIISNKRVAEAVKLSEKYLK